MSFWRSLRRAAVAGGTMGGFALGQLVRSPDGRRRHGPQALRRRLERLGGTYIKFGQLLALQPDIIPQHYCEALFDLLDRVPPFPVEEVRRTFAEDFGKRPESAFASFEATPIASASVSQVHVAFRDGRKLAVKVRRPRAPHQFGDDLAFLGWLARCIRRLRLRSLNWLARAIGELALWTREELDFRQEARYQRSLASFSRRRSQEVVPAVLEELSSERVLTSEFLEGPTVLQFLRSRGLAGEQREDDPRAIEVPEGFDPHQFAGNLVENFVSDAFEHGLFHADLHPANLLILPGNAVGYVDFGITGALSPYTRRHIVSMILALMRGDREAVQRHFFAVSTAEKDADVEAFERQLETYWELWFERRRGAVALRASFTKLMVDLLRVSRHCGVVATPDTVRYMRSVISAEGVIRRLAPSYDLVASLERICREVLEAASIRQWLSIERVGDVGAAAAGLVRQAPVLLSRIAGERAAEHDPLPIGERYDDGDSAGGGPAGAARSELVLGALALAASLVVAAAPVKALGLNLFTGASAAVLGCVALWAGVRLGR